MADLTDIQAAESIKIIGNNSSGLETNPVNSRNNGDLNVGDLLTTGGVQGNLVVGTSPVEIKVGGSRLINRKTVTAMAIDATLYWGYNNTVTTSSGTPIQKNQMFEWAMDDSGSIFLIADNANKNARITESP